MDKVEEVVIDSDGVFKYILIELTEKVKKGKHNGAGADHGGSPRKMTIVRGFEWAEFHADILDRVTPKLHELGLDYECVGGGRIRHDSKDKKIHIYGYSVGFGQANHQVTQQLIQKTYDYPKENITWSNGGY